MNFPHIIVKQNIYGDGVSFRLVTRQANHILLGDLGCEVDEFDVIGTFEKNSTGLKEAIIIMIMEKHHLKNYFKQKNYDEFMRKYRYSTILKVLVNIFIFDNDMGIITAPVSKTVDSSCGDIFPPEKMKKYIRDPLSDYYF